MRVFTGCLDWLWLNVASGELLPHSEQRVDSRLGLPRCPCFCWCLARMSSQSTFSPCSNLSRSSGPSGDPRVNISRAKGRKTKMSARLRTRVIATYDVSGLASLPISKSTMAASSVLPCAACPVIAKYGTNGNCCLLTRSRSLFRALSRNHVFVLATIGSI